MSEALIGFSFKSFKLLVLKFSSKFSFELSHTFHFEKVLSGPGSMHVYRTVTLYTVPTTLNRVRGVRIADAHDPSGVKFLKFVILFVCMYVLMHVGSYVSMY